MTLSFANGTITFTDGVISLRDPSIIEKVLEKQQRLEAEAAAAAVELSRCYTLAGFAKRLLVSLPTALRLITDGKVGHTCLGHRNYRISERAVRRFEDGLPPLFAPPETQTTVATPHAKELTKLPAPDPWLTIPEAAAYAKLTEPHMRLLVLGKPYRAAEGSRPERPAMPPRIPAGDTGFARGTRVRQSAVDAYLNRHAYRQAGLNRTN